MAFRFVELSRSPHSPIAQCGYQTVVGVIFPVYIRMYRYERFHQNYQALRTVALNKLDRSQRSQKVARRVRRASTTSAARGSNGSHDVCSISPCESALVRFSRPHTVVGTTISVCSMTFLAAANMKIIHTSYILAQALVPAIFMNFAIVGLNQIYDRKIDQINKPYLPVASGELSVDSALLFVAFSIMAAFIWGCLSGSIPLMFTLLVSLMLGVLYSVDHKLLRWKRYPLLAAACIVLVRAFTVHIGFFLHARLQQSGVLAPESVVSTLATVVLIMSIYSIVIALFKDLPDISGDKLHGINTVSVRFGVPYTFRICFVLLLLAHFCGMIAGVYCGTNIGRCVLVLGHLWATFVTVVKARSVDKLSSSSLHAYYMYIWRLFYFEYFLLIFLS